MHVGTRILTYLESKGITQAFVARSMGMPLTKLNMVLHGKRRLQLDEYNAICDALELPYGTFLADPDKQQ